MVENMQEDLFSFIDKGFCFDEDINTIVDMLDKIFAEHEQITKIKKEWGIWDHVPNLGYRLSYHISFEGHLGDNVFTELEETVEYAKTKKIGLSPYGYTLYKSDNTGHMSIYSIYKDKRIKIK